MSYEGPEDIPGYRDLVRIGQGGFSVVYRAQQEAFDRTVAVKVLMVGSDETVQRRFMREAKLTGRLSDHPHVVTILDAGVTWSGRPYLTTEFYERGSLHDRLRTDGALPAAEVVHIGAKIADALAAAHEIGMLHRDVKPSNILISRFGQPVLADFGVAVLLDAAAGSTMLDVFSPHHAAPEVLNNAGPAPAGDIYALGSTLFQLLHGMAPFTGDVAAVLWQTIHSPVPDRACPELPDLPAVLAVALAKDPRDRYPDAAAFADALRALAPADPSPPPPRLALPAYADETALVVAKPAPQAAPEHTIFRPDRMIARAAPAPKRKRRKLLLLLGGLVLLAGAATAFVVFDRAGRSPAVALSLAPSPSPVTEAELAKARPTTLIVQDDGDNATVRWSVPAGRQDQLFLQTVPLLKMQPVPKGANEFRVTGLDPKVGYCFTVGAVITWGNPSVIAWSGPTCIRGAVPSAESK